jgi:hypothetical protein
VKAKAILANIGLGILFIYSAVGLVYFLAWFLPLVAPVFPVLMANFFLIPVGILFMLIVVVVPVAALTIGISLLTSLVHRAIGLNCCK